MNLTDDELIFELSHRFEQSRNAFSALVLLNRKLLEMNERLENSESLKSNFLSNIRNEINNPLNAILGMSQQIQSLGRDNAAVCTVAGMIGDEAARLDFQLSNIFIAAELEAGEVSPHSRQTNLENCISGVADCFVHTARLKSVRIERDSGNIAVESEQNVLTDPTLLKLILSNLIANAVEFSPEGGIVRIFSEITAEGGIIFSVRDCGPGIHPDNHSRIFDRFVQLEKGSTRSHRGHGLGLSVARGVAEILQGDITVESSDGNGAVFTATLPPCPVAEDSDTFTESGNMFFFDEMREA